jgi:hypothetical protein
MGGGSLSRRREPIETNNLTSDDAKFLDFKMWSIHEYFEIMDTFEAAH